MNSMSSIGTPARYAIATPSPVFATALVVWSNTWPIPPVARMTPPSARKPLTSPLWMS